MALTVTGSEGCDATMDTSLVGSLAPCPFTAATCIEYSMSVGMVVRVSGEAEVYTWEIRQ